MSSDSFRRRSPFLGVTRETVYLPCWGSRSRIHPDPFPNIAPMTVESTRRSKGFYFDKFVMFIIIPGPEYVDFPDRNKGDTKNRVSTPLLSSLLKFPTGYSRLNLCLQTDSFLLCVNTRGSPLLKRRQILKTQKRTLSDS